MPKYAECKLTYDSYTVQVLVKYTEGDELKIYDDVNDEWYYMDDESLSFDLLSKSDHPDHALAVTAIIDMLSNSFDYNKIIGSKDSPNFIDLDSYL